MNIDLEAMELRLTTTPVVSQAPFFGPSIYASQAHDMAALIAKVKTLETEKRTWQIIHDAELDRADTANRTCIELASKLDAAQGRVLGWRRSYFRLIRQGAEQYTTNRQLTTELAESRKNAGDLGVLVLAFILEKARASQLV